MKLLYAFLFFLFCFGLKAQKTVPHEVIVVLKEGKNHSDLYTFLTGNKSVNNLKINRKLSQTEEIYLLETTDKTEAKITSLVNRSLFTSISPSRLSSLRANPDDPLFVNQWNLMIMDLEQAWDVSTGGQTIEGDEIVIAVLDDGFFLDEEDWGDNLYNNPHEQIGDANSDGCPGDCGIDDDGDGLIDEDNFGREPGDPGYDPSFNDDDDENGYIDDLVGLNASNQSDNHSTQRHGTGSAGIIGAKSNNSVGISGINWNIKILPLSSGLREADVIETYNYITEMRRLYNETNGEKGAFIVACNYSLGVDFGMPSDFEVWCSLYDKMGEQGIINVSAVSNTNYNIDDQGDIPSLCDSDYLIATTSTDIDDNFADAAFGRINVDVAGPGEDAFSLHPLNNSGYGLFSGTSAAAPHVAGLVGLLYSVDCPEFISYFKENPSEVDSLAELIVQSGDQLESLASLVRSEKRINAIKAMIEVSRWCGGTSGDVEISTLYPNPTTDFINYEFSADPSEKIYLKIYNTLGQIVLAREDTFPLFEKAEGTINTRDLQPGLYFFTLQQGRNYSTYKFLKV